MEGEPRSERADRTILCVGLSCLDIINHCDRYPQEDEDIRAQDQRWRSGGNAHNTLVVLSLLGRQCELLATLGSGMETDFVTSHLDQAGVAHGNCAQHVDYRLPTSYIVLNTSNGSRTIVHYRNLPELRYEDFAKLNLSQYSWIHFEGRHTTEYVRMMQKVVEYNRGVSHRGEDKVVVSVEAEKKRPDLEELLPLADVVLLSKDYAVYKGCSSMEMAVKNLRSMTKERAIVVCAWGDKGAAASDEKGEVFTCGAFSPPQLVDTLAAGDTFNAGIIHRLSLMPSGQNRDVKSALEFACRLAGAKCGMEGLEGLKDFSLQSSP